MYPSLMAKKKRQESMENKEDQNLELESLQTSNNVNQNDNERMTNELSQYNNMINYYTHSTYGNEPYYETTYPNMYQNGTNYNYENTFSLQNPNEYTFTTYPQHFYTPEIENIFYEDSTNKDGRGPVSLKFIEGKTRRGVTFSKRKKGLMKKAYELSVLTGSEILVLVASEGGNVFTFSTDRFKKIIENHQNLIKECLQDSPFIANDKENHMNDVFALEEDPE